MGFYNPELHCSYCGDDGHTVRKCFKLSSMSSMSPDDILFWSCVDPEDRPEGFIGDDSEDDSARSDNDVEESISETEFD